MSVCIPSLSEQGWVTDSSKVLNQVISYYILTDIAQSLVFQGNLINLPYTYFQFINDPDQMSAGIKTDLDKLLSRYFGIVEVETNVKKLTESRYAILLYGAVIDNESNRIEISKVADINTTGLRKVIDVNNYGDGLAMLSSLS